jgi:hypothetical protein
VDGDLASPSAPVEFEGGIVRFKTTADLQIDSDLTVRNGGVATVESGGAITCESGGGILMESGSVINVQAGAVEAINGTLTVNSTQNLENGSELNVKAGSQINVKASSAVIFEGSTTPTYDSARTFTRTACHVANFDGAKWAQTIVPNVGYYTSNSTAAASEDVITFAIDPPDGCTITAVSVWTDPPGAHAGEPGAKTTVKLYEQNVATGAAITTVFTEADPATVGGATYEPAHAITKSGLSHVVDKSTKTYFVVVIPESGANSIVGTKIWPPRFTFTRAKLGEE